jgi:DNA-binding response OmpR family regulator
MPRDDHAVRVQPRHCSAENTILLAGDDSRDRNQVRRLLLDQGYVVLEPGNSRVDAIFTSLGRHIDLVVLHLTSEAENEPLPDWLASSPGIPVVICTPQQQVPFSGEKLLRKLRKLLDRPHPRHRIMVVDEDVSLRRMIVAVLEAAGYEVSEAGDGDAALRSVAKQKPDAVLTEMVLPGTDGLQLVEALRKSDSDTKIIAVSGSSRADTYLWVARSLGANAALHKPLWVEEVLQNIRNLLKDSLQHRLHYVNDGF